MVDRPVLADDLEVGVARRGWRVTSWQPRQVTPFGDWKVVSMRRALTGSWQPAQSRDTCGPTSPCSVLTQKATIASLAACAWTLVCHAAYSFAWHFPQ